MAILRERLFDAAAEQTVALHLHLSSPALAAGTTGDMDLSVIEGLADLMRVAKRASVDLLAEAQVNPSRANAILAEKEGPATLDEFRAAAGAIEQAAAAWNALLRSALESVVAVLTLVPRDEGTPYTTQAPFVRRWIPAAQADALRQSDELDALRAAVAASVGR